MKRRYVALLHAGYWTLYLLLLAVVFAVLRLAYGREVSLVAVMASRIGVLSIVPNLVAFYLAYALLFPLLERRRFAALSLATLLGAAASATLGALALFLALGTNEPVFASATELVSLIGVLTVVALIHMAIALVMRGFVGWFGDIRVKEELGRKHLEVEMDLVRSKLDPHFLFNTLNNIDVLIARDPEAASRYLNSLCEIMRFVLYETDAPAIPLAAELSYIGKYIALQRIRVPSPRYARFDVHDEVNGLVTPPMLLVPLIENAFKHAERRGDDEAIGIDIGVERGRLDFRCTNTYHRGRSAAPSRGGLGHELITRRLELLYPGRHTLTVADDGDRYTVHLTVDLDAGPLHHR